MKGRGHEAAKEKWERDYYIGGSVIACRACVTYKKTLFPIFTSSQPGLCLYMIWLLAVLDIQNIQP